MAWKNLLKENKSILQWNTERTCNIYSSKQNKVMAQTQALVCICPYPITSHSLFSFSFKMVLFQRVHRSFRKQHVLLIAPYRQYGTRPQCFEGKRIKYGYRMCCATCSWSNRILPGSFYILTFCILTFV